MQDFSTHFQVFSIHIDALSSIAKNVQHSGNTISHAVNVTGRQERQIRKTVTPFMAIIQINAKKICSAPKKIGVQSQFSMV